MIQRAVAFEIAQDLGFDLVAVAPLEPPPRAREFEAWLDAGQHGDMGYLERQRAKISDPAQILPGALSLLIVGVAHGREALELEGGARLARYAAGRDYHNWIGKRLTKLAKRLGAEGLLGPSRAITDAGPVLERSHAARSGLGAESKAANLLAPTHGPWFFLGELLISEALEPGPAQADPLPNCGTCTACLDACPTDAIFAPGQVDARLCISYLTIEHRAAIPRDLRASIGPWVFGCDICSEVCPWGHKAPDQSARFGTYAALEAPQGTEGGPLVTWLGTREGFSQTFNGSPLQRPKREGLARNAAIVLGNLPSEGGREALLEALEFDPSAIVRASAGWALAQGHGADRGVREALEAALGRETDDEARRDLEQSLAVGSR